MINDNLKLPFTLSEIHEEELDVFYYGNILMSQRLIFGNKIHQSMRVGIMNVANQLAVQYTTNEILIFNFA